MKGRDDSAHPLLVLLLLQKNHFNYTRTTSSEYHIDITPENSFSEDSHDITSIPI